MRARVAAILVAAVLAAAAFSLIGPRLPVPVTTSTAPLPAPSRSAAPGPTAADEGEAAGPAIGLETPSRSVSGTTLRRETAVALVPPRRPESRAPVPRARPHPAAAIPPGAGPAERRPDAGVRSSTSTASPAAPSEAGTGAAVESAAAAAGAAAGRDPSGAGDVSEARSSTGSSQAAGTGSGLPAPPAVSTAPPVVTPPRVIATPGLVYPGDAFQLTVRHEDLGAAAVLDGSEGTVTVRALILSAGEVRSVEVAVSSGSIALDRAAADAVRRWRFAPAARDGVAIDAYVTLKIRYVVR